MKSLTLKPGSIIVWKEYNAFQKFWAKLRRKDLTYNRCCIIPRRMDFISFREGEPLFRVIEPKKQYSSTEKDILIENLDKEIKFKSCVEYLSIANIVRPSTFDLSTLTLESLFDNKYYREVYAEEC